MKILIRDLTTKELVTFPMLPNEIKLESAANFTTYNIMELGEVMLPNGEQLHRISWSGTLPGNMRRNQPYVTHWETPGKMQSRWSDWRHSGKRLWLTITDTPINLPVYLANYSVTYQGGFGDIAYDISFTQLKIIDIQPVSKVSNVSKATATPKSGQKKKIYTVQSGDSLWRIAAHELGTGDKFPQIYKLNEAEINRRNRGKKVDKYTIYPGQVLNLP